VCAAVPVLRKRQPEAAWFRVPGGMFLPILGVLICVALLTHADFSKTVILGAVMAVALLNWFLVRNRPDAAEVGNSDPVDVAARHSREGGVV